MNNIEIAKATDRYSCNLCKGKFESIENLYEITIGSINICLCADCFNTLRTAINEFSLKPQAESEVAE